MSTLEVRLGEYLAMRRALGYGLARQEKLLAQYLAFLADRGESQVTIASALVWAKLPAGGEAWWSYRLGAIRPFARVTVQVPVGVLRWLGRKLVVCRELCMCDGCRRYCGAAEL